MSGTRLSQKASTLIKDQVNLKFLQYRYKYDLQETFCNIGISLRIYCRLSTSASRERSFSKLKIIKTYLRLTINQEGLSGLAIVAISKKGGTPCKVVSRLERNSAGTYGVKICVLSCMFVDFIFCIFSIFNFM